MIKYEIEGGNLPVVICHPTAGETICTEGGAMSWMSPNMEMKTAAGGFKKAIGRLFSGVHWFSDIVGGLLFSVGFVLLFKNMSSIVSKQ